MFAVLKTGGKQYKVSSGDILRVEKLAAEAGDTVQFNEILMVDGTIGTPLVEGAGVQAEVIEQIKGKKVIHFVKRRRKHSSKRTKGHRQQLTLLRVTDILASGADATGVKAALGASTSAPSYEANAEKKSVDAVETVGDAKADLARIKSLGPKMADALIEAGVTSLAQIATWGPDEVSKYDALLTEAVPAYKTGRLEEQDWVKLAQELTESA